jgi:EAL domain-containing protein (putative c-di-GMP-specific phosphodiesterase class I)
MLVNYQPIVDLGSRKVVRAEALCRFADNREGLGTPDEFIKYAEEHGLIKDLTDFLLEKTLEFWQKLGPLGPEGLALNLSVQNLEEGDLADRVLESLRKHQVRPERLSLEFDERVVRINDLGQTANLERLSKAGVKITVDGFGPSLSTFSRLELETMPVNELKVDRAMIQDLDTDPKTRAAVKAIAELAHEVHLELAASGIESESTVEWLGRFGFTRIQGFLIAPAMDEAAFSAWLSRSGPNAA